MSNLQNQAKTKVPKTEILKSKTSPWRIVATVILVLLASSICVRAGFWQWHRHLDRSAFINSVNDNYTTFFDAEVSEVNAHQNEWQQLTITGHYLPESTRWLRNRPVDGQSAQHQIVLFETTDKELIAINRGWIPNPDSTPSVAQPRSEELTISGRIRPDEPDARQANSSDFIYEINTEIQVREQGISTTGTHIANFYLRLSSEVPSEDSPLIALGKPDLNPRSHLSYAFQWWFFSLAIPFVATFIALRKAVSWSAKKQSNPFNAITQKQREQDKLQRGPSEEQVEDALFD